MISACRSALPAFMIAGAMSVASAASTDRLPRSTAHPSALDTAGFVLMPASHRIVEDLTGPGKTQQAAGTSGMLTGSASYVNGATSSIRPFTLNPALVDSKPSAALLLVEGVPTAVMEDDTPSGTRPNPGEGSKNEKTNTRVNILTGLGTTSGKEYQSLSGKQRLEYYLNQNFISLGAIVGPLLSSLLDQANAQPPEWGGGIQGYGKRLASRLGTGIVQGTAQSAGCALLGQEPRYIKSSSDNIFARIGHGFLYSLITYNNEGKKRIAFATLASYYASSITTNLWLPDRFNALGDGVRDGNRQVILAGFVNQWQEFWPEIRKYILRRS